MIEFTLNGKPVSLEVEADTPLLWAIRENVGLTGTKFGCGIGVCGACTVHFNGMAMRSCVLPVGAVAGSQVTTIEGLDHPVKQAWLEEQVPQCGYCQPGQMMAASSLLNANPAPTDEDIDRGMTNLCRCATYDRIRRGIKRAVELLPPPPEPEPEPEPAVEGAEGAEAQPAEGAAQ
jgi:isoquinoline 1-oxidoreductase subunit alpha